MNKITVFSYPFLRGGVFMEKISLNLLSWRSVAGARKRLSSFFVMTVVFALGLIIWSVPARAQENTKHGRSISDGNWTRVSRR